MNDVVVWNPTAHVSQYFTWGEFAVSDTHPELVVPVPVEYRPNIQQLATRILDPIRIAIGQPMHSWSGYRSRILNGAIGGSPTSQHTVGEADDWSFLHRDGRGFDHATTEEAWMHLLGGTINVPCGQCIYYPWGGKHGSGTPFVHIALPGTHYPEPSFHLHDPAHGWHYLHVTSCIQARKLLATLPDRPANR